MPLIAYRRDDKFIHINESYFVRRREFKRKVIDEAHDLYYWLNGVMKDSHLAEILSDYMGGTKNSWVTFLGTDLFERNSRGILNTKIGGYFWRFWRFARALFRRLSRVKGGNKCVTKILDRRMV